MWMKVPVPCSSVLCIVPAESLDTNRAKRAAPSSKPKKSSRLEVSVPEYFGCPISLELMRDPVTTSTGQTYDRSSIEKWFEKGHNTCPSTRQVLEDMEIVPNHTLRRLIQEWQVSNQEYGVERMPTPKQHPVEFHNAKRMLQEVGQGCYGSLRNIRAIAKESDRGRQVVAEAGAIPVLGNIVFSPDSLGKNLDACEEALGILVLLPVSNMRTLLYIGPKQLTAISWLLCKGSLDGRTNAAFLLALLATDDEMKLTIGATAGLFEGLVQLLKEDHHAKAIKAGLKALHSISGPVRNRDRAVEAGVVSAIVEIMPEAGRSNTERALSILDTLCSRLAGREAVCSHALAVPVLVRAISSMSDYATEKAVSCLWAVCQHAPKECVDEAAVQAGVLTQLLHLLQVENNNSRTKQKASELLGQLRHRWRHCERQMVTSLPRTSRLN